VRVSRADFVNTTRTQLGELDEGLANTMIRLQTESTFEQYLNQRSVRAQIAEAQAKLAVLRAASPGFDGTEFTQRYLNYEDRIVRVRRELAIRVEGDSLIAIFPRRVVNLLTDLGVRASLGRPIDGQSSIQVRTDIQPADYEFDKEVKITLWLITRDEKGNQLATVEHNEVGTSPNSEESARKQAEIMLAEEAEKQGVFTYLGLRGDGRQ
jgi:hypothetical protein